MLYRIVFLKDLPRKNITQIISQEIRKDDIGDGRMAWWPVNGTKKAEKVFSDKINNKHKLKIFQSLLITLNKGNNEVGYCTSEELKNL